MCGPGQLLFKCGTETPKGWTPLHENQQKVQHTRKDLLTQTSFQLHLLWAVDKAWTLVKMDVKVLNFIFL